MGSEMDLLDEFRSEVEVAFSFLFEEAGFASPETTEHGLLFRGPGLEVDVWLFDGREPEVATGVAAVGADGIRGQRAWLDELYVAAGCGPAQDVPGSAPTRRSTIKRVHQHAAALRRLMTGLAAPELSQLIIRFAGS
ncbi:hypothetical protein ACFV9E_13445 [Streptomyces sp. NPDC059835]|uniref:hypothetical protein n=1 Tax=Streptomyces sp. NPDC059835 TaxID=3346967 RepID=UPI00364B9C75